MDRTELERKLAEAKAEVDRLERELKKPEATYLGAMYHPGNGDGAKIVTIDAPLQSYNLATKALANDAEMELRSAPYGFIALFSVSHNDSMEIIAYATGDRWSYDKDAVIRNAYPRILDHLGYARELVMSNELTKDDVGKQFLVVETGSTHKSLIGMTMKVTRVDMVLMGDNGIVFDFHSKPKFWQQFGFHQENCNPWKLRRIL